MVVPSFVLMALAQALASPGEAEGDGVRGPAALCFHHSRFMLHEGEQVLEVHRGVHGVQIHIAGPHGPYQVSESESYAPPRRRGPVVLRDGDVAVHRIRRGTIGYAYFTRPEFSPDHDVMLATLSGEALDGGGNDAAIYRRFIMGTPQPETCDHRYGYGFSVIFGDSF